MGKIHEIRLKEKCLRTIINTCKINFDKIKQNCFIKNGDGFGEVVVLDIDKNNVLIITSSGLAANGIKDNDGKIEARTLVLDGLTMEQIYNCLTQLTRKISSKNKNMYERGN